MSTITQCGALQNCYEWRNVPSYRSSYPKFQRKFTVKVGSSTSGNAT